jgi:hypothetical protein
VVLGELYCHAFYGKRGLESCVVYKRWTLDLIYVGAAFRARDILWPNRPPAFYTANGVSGRVYGIFQPTR